MGWPRQVYFFLELTTTDCYACSLYARIRIRNSAFLLFLKPIFIISMASLLLNPTNAASRCDHSHSHTQTHRLQRLARCSHIRPQAKQLRRSSSVSTATTAIQHSTNAQSLFCNRGGSSLSYVSRSSASSRSSADNGTGSGRRESAPMSL